MSDMNLIRGTLTTVCGFGTGYGVATAWHALKPVFTLDPRAAGIAAAIGALFFTLRHNAEQNQYKQDSSSPHLAARAQFKNNAAHFVITTLALFVAHQVLRYSHFNSTIGQTLTGVVIGLGAKLVVDYLFLPARPSAK